MAISHIHLWIIHMTVLELAATLREMYGNAPDGDHVVMIHLFAIKYASFIEATGATCKDIAKAAGIQASYGTEIRKGVRLAEYVQVTSWPKKPLHPTAATSGAMGSQ